MNGYEGYECGVCHTKWVSIAERDRCARRGTPKHKFQIGVTFKYQPPRARRRVLAKIIDFGYKLKDNVHVVYYWLELTRPGAINKSYSCIDEAELEILLKGR